MPKTITRDDELDNINIALDNDIRYDTQNTEYESDIERVSLVKHKEDKIGKNNKVDKADKFEKDDKTNKNHNFLEEECAICLEKIGSKDYCILENCFHKFHDSCISEWYQTTNNQICPECNTINKNRIVIKVKQIENKKYIKPISPIKLAKPKVVHNSYSQNNQNNQDEDDEQSCSKTCSCLIS